MLSHLPIHASAASHISREVLPGHRNRLGTGRRNGQRSPACIHLPIKNDSAQRQHYRLSAGVRKILCMRSSQNAVTGRGHPLAPGAARAYFRGCSVGYPSSAPLFTLICGSLLPFGSSMPGYRQNPFLQHYSTAPKLDCTLSHDNSGVVYFHASY